MKRTDDTYEKRNTGQGLVLRWTWSTVRVVGGAVGFPTSAERSQVPTHELRLAGGWSRLAIA